MVPRRASHTRREGSPPRGVRPHTPLRAGAGNRCRLGGRTASFKHGLRTHFRGPGEGRVSGGRALFSATLTRGGWRTILLVALFGPAGEVARRRQWRQCRGSERQRQEQSKGQGQSQERPRKTLLGGYKDRDPQVRRIS